MPGYPVAVTASWRTPPPAGRRSGGGATRRNVRLLCRPVRAAPWHGARAALPTPHAAATAHTPDARTPSPPTGNRAPARGAHRGRRAPGARRGDAPGVQCGRTRPCQLHRISSTSPRPASSRRVGSPCTGVRIISKSAAVSTLSAARREDRRRMRRRIRPLHACYSSSWA